MCQAVVLAAGYSSRAKLNKMALEFEGIPILERIVMTLLQVCGEVIVVTGHYHDSVVELVGDIEGVTLVYNKGYSQGMFSSVLTGIACVTGDCLLTPGDYPYIKVSTCEQLLKAKGPIVVPTFANRRGHPMFLRAEIVETLKVEAVTSNLKVFRDRHKVNYIDVDDEGILLDVDTMEDYNAIRKV